MREDGLIHGALPTALYSDSSVLAAYNIATPKQHAQMRIIDPSTPCSTDPRFIFVVFNAIVNTGLRGHDTRLVLHHGFAERQGNEGARFKHTNGNE